MLLLLFYFVSFSYFPITSCRAGRNILSELRSFLIFIFILCKCKYLAVRILVLVQMVIPIRKVFISNECDCSMKNLTTKKKIDLDGGSNDIE